MNFKNEREMTAQNYANAYAREVQNSISNTVSQSNMILRYGYLTDNLNTHFEKNTEKLEFLNNISAYFDTIYSNASAENVIIYNQNDSIYDSRYFQKISSLANADEIFDFFEKNNTSIYRETTILKDSQSRRYFIFYRKMPFNKGCILACRCYIPESSEFAGSADITYTGRRPAGNCVTTQIDDSYTAYAPIESGAARNTFFILIFAALGIMFMTITIVLAYRTTAKTTAEIERFINSLAGGDLLMLELSPNSSDHKELAIIKSAISSLVTSIKEATEANHKIKFVLQNLELQLLQNKFNPHLLYNSLSVIKLKAFRYKDKEIMTIINDLVAYYRAVLNKDKKNITISDEMILLEKFVSVNEISHGKKYNLSFDIPDSVKGVKIPHLLLQPFIENSISHGLSAKSGECQILVSCRAENSIIRFTVFDNGIGMSTETLEKLSDLDSYDGSYGIKNVWLRLKLMYGSDCKILFESIEGEYTKATIVISDTPSFTL